MKKHEEYWEKFVKNNGLSQMIEWCGDSRGENRSYPRKLLKRMDYTSILDAGAGVCAEYYGFKRDYPEIKYTALDITPSFVKAGKENGINIIEGSVENIPFPDNSFDVVYIRDTLRHVEFYEKVVREALRVCRKEVMIVFCRQLSNNKEHIKDFKEDFNVYNIMYSKKKVRKFVETLGPKWFYFETIQGKEYSPDSLLRIFKVINPITKYKLYVYTKYRTYIWNMLLPFRLFIRLVQKVKRIILRLEG